MAPSTSTSLSPSSSSSSLPPSATSPSLRTIAQRWNIDAPNETEVSLFRRGLVLGALASSSLALLSLAGHFAYGYYKPRYTKYRLEYFNAKGLAEVTRYLFALAKVDYEDYRYSAPPAGQRFPEEFVMGREQLPFTRAPVLHVGSGSGVVTLAQSRSIERFVAKQFGFMGSSRLEEQLIDAVGEEIRDIMDEFNKVKTNEEEKEKFYKGVLPQRLRYLNRYAVAHSTSANRETFVGSSISLADVQFFYFLSNLDKQESVNAAIAAYPNLSSIRAAVSNREEIREWIAKRPL